jgi:hypothetical protein
MKENSVRRLRKISESFSRTFSRLDGVPQPATSAMDARTIALDWLDVP